LTVPLLAFVLVDRAGRGAAGAILGSAMTFSIGVLAWAVPMLVASGGLIRYRDAFAGQTAEQFTGLDIFLSNPTARRMALGMVAALVEPWALPPLGWLVILIGFAGFVYLAWRAPRAATLVGVAFVPYAIFHLVVQESYTRYALPLVVPVAYLAVKGLSAGGTMIATLGSAAIVVVSLATTLPATRAYSENPAPAFAAADDLKMLLSSQPGVIGAHQRFARLLETRDFGETRILPSPVMNESRESRLWLGAVGRRRYGISPIRREATWSWSIRSASRGMRITRGRFRASRSSAVCVPTSSISCAWIRLQAGLRKPDGISPPRRSPFPSARAAAKPWRT
jgi:hypothetical protein